MKTLIKRTKDGFVEYEVPDDYDMNQTVYGQHLDEEGNVVYTHTPKDEYFKNRTPLSKAAKDARKPLPPWVLMNALNDPVHTNPPNGKVTSEPLFKKPNKTFVDECLKGNVSPDEVDDFIDMWHASKEARTPLRVFLGFTIKEYARWCGDPNSLQDILNSRLQGDT